MEIVPLEHKITALDKWRTHAVGRDEGLKRIRISAHRVDQGAAVYVLLTESEALKVAEATQAETPEQAHARGRREVLSPVLADIIAERAAQDAKWGGADHDDEHTVDDWGRYIQDHFDRAYNPPEGQADAHYRRQLIRVAALVVAAVESLDRHHARNGTVPS